MQPTGKIKVLFAINYAISRGEGRSRVLLEYARYLDHSKFHISILQFTGSRFSPMKEKEILEYTGADKIYTIRSNDRSLLPLYSKGFIGYILTVFLQPFLYRVKKRQIDRITGKERMIVYLFENNLRFSFGKEKIIIGSTHSWDLSDIGLLKKINVVLRAKLWNIDYFHIFPQFKKSVLLIKPKKYLCMGNGIDADNYTPGNLLKDNIIRILYVGRLEKCKGILFFLKVAEAFKGNNKVIFTVIGSGTEENYVESVSKKLKNLEFLGNVDDTILSKVYKESLLLLFPSNCDTFGMAVLEALSCGIRVIGSEKLTEVFKHASDLGYYTPLPNDLSFYVEKINDALAMLNEIEVNRLDQHKLISEEYGWDKLILKLSEFIVSLSQEINS